MSLLTEAFKASKKIQNETSEVSYEQYYGRLKPSDMAKHVARELFISEGDSPTSSWPYCPYADTSYLTLSFIRLEANSVLAAIQQEIPWAIKEGERRVALRYANKYTVEGIL